MLSSAETGLLTAAVLIGIALLQFVWLYRARSARRWKAALDAYAAREMARDDHREAPPLRRLRIWRESVS
jgi:hypothetical protein